MSRCRDVKAASGTAENWLDLGCEAHHVLEWTNDGPTDLDNLSNR